LQSRILAIGCVYWCANSGQAFPSLPLHGPVFARNIDCPRGDVEFEQAAFFKSSDFDEHDDRGLGPSDHFLNRHDADKC
jgi:hypothetical protein